VLTVITLYLVAEGVTQTGGLDLAMNMVLGKASTVFWAQVRRPLHCAGPVGREGTLTASGAAVAGA
jgi:hypothetical protein